MPKSFRLNKRVLYFGLLFALVLALVPAFAGSASRAEASGAASIGAARNPETTVIYVVRRGDTLGSIARRFNTTISALMQLNGITNPDRIYVGQRLRVPSSSGGGTGTPTKPVRIKFPTGGISATVTGAVAFPNRYCYVAGALAGQQMTVQITSAGQKANFLITSPDGQPLKRLENEDRTWTGKLPSNGDYLICVATPSGTVAYNLTVTILPLNSQPAPTRIKFAPGAISAVVSGNVGNNDRVCYILAARKNQLMTVQVSSPANVVNFSLVGADGSPLKRIENGPPFYSVRLPLTEDYTVCVGAPAGTPSTYYALVVTITN